MNSYPTHERSAFSSVSESPGGRLPVELIFNIIDTAIVQHREVNLSWSLTLSLVCHAVRAFVLPIIYEFIFLDIESDKERIADVQLVFLSWLLHDPTAPPRQHIKHILFRHDGRLDPTDLAQPDRREGDKPADWPLERLTVRHFSDAACLCNVGLRPRQTFHVGWPSHASEVLPSNIFARLLAQAIQDQTHLQLWVGEPEKLAVGRSSTRITPTRITRTNIDPQTELVAEKAATETLLTVQLVNGDCIQHYPNMLLAGVAAFLNAKTDRRIILACSEDYRVAGQTVAEFIRAAVPTALPKDALEGRVRISHAGWAPKPVGAVLDFGMFDALAQALRCGRDPWDLGCALAP